jgi:hypothetical protein
VGGVRIKTIMEKSSVGSKAVVGADKPMVFEFHLRCLSRQRRNMKRTKFF